MIVYILEAAVIIWLLIIVLIIPYRVQNYSENKHDIYLYTQKCNEYYTVYYSFNLTFSTMFEDITEANARAKMLIWLIENGHVKGQ